jgi:hypothetical protein
MSFRINRAFTALLVLCITSACIAQQPTPPMDFQFAVPQIVPAVQNATGAAPIGVGAGLTNGVPASPSTQSSTPAAAGTPSSPTVAGTHTPQVEQAFALLDQLNVIAQSVYRSVGLNPVGDVIDEAVNDMKLWISSQEQTA